MEANKVPNPNTPSYVNLQKPKKRVSRFWRKCENVILEEGREYLISDGVDVTEAQWYHDSKWGGHPYDDYKWVRKKPKPPKIKL